MLFSMNCIVLYEFLKYIIKHSIDSKKFIDGKKPIEKRTSQYFVLATFLFPIKLTQSTRFESFTECRASMRRTSKIRRRSYD